MGERLYFFIVKLLDEGCFYNNLVNLLFHWRFPPKPQGAGLIGSKFDQRQRREIFVATI